MTAPAPCPICNRALPTAETEARYRPFCSQRCQQVDLVRWSEGRYAIVEPLDDENLFEQSAFDDLAVD